MTDERSGETDDGDEDGDEPNQYGGGTQDVDAVEQTERMTEDDESDEEEGGEGGNETADGDGGID